MKKPQTLGVRNAALQLGCTQKYVRDLLYEERIPGAKKEGHKWEIPVVAIDQRIRERETRNARK